MTIDKLTPSRKKTLVTFFLGLATLVVNLCGVMPMSLRMSASWRALMPQLLATFF
jgi:hypothetical protein